ncbi:hypothetical protein D3C72_1435970 [compost metagenome]
MHGEDVAVRGQALGRAGTAVADVAVVVGDLSAACAQVSAVTGAQACGELGDGRRDVEQDPVPEATAGGRVRVVQRQRETLGAFRRALPMQRGRTVLAGAVVAIELMHALQRILILEFRRC